MSTPLQQSMCLRCSLRLTRYAEHQSLPHRAAFSTTSPLAANPPKKKAVVARPTSRQGKSLRLSKNKRVASSKPPAVGERKALRKKLVLSNVNALEVAGLEDLTPDKLRGQDQLEGVKGSVLGLREKQVDALRALEAFKPTQGWGLFRRPATLVRDQTVDLARDVEAARQGKTVRKILFGARGSGKSVLLLQAMAMASLKNWVIIHIPEAKDLTIAQTAYRPITGKDGKVVYEQPQYTAHLLDNIVKANGPVLSKLRLSKNHADLPIPSLQSNMSLDRFAGLGVRDPEVAGPIWRALLDELRTPSNAEDTGLARPPVLFAIDGVDHLMRNSAYLAPDSTPIHAHDLALVRDFCDLLSPTNNMPNGGLVLAATCESNRASSPTLDFCLKRNDARAGQREGDLSQDPYFAYDDRVLAALRDVGVMKVSGLSKAEARGVMEYYARSGMLRQAVTDSLIGEKWTMSGGGIVGELERGSVKLRF